MGRAATNTLWVKVEKHRSNKSREFPFGLASWYEAKQDFNSYQSSRDCILEPESNGGFTSLFQPRNTERESAWTARINEPCVCAIRSNCPVCFLSGWYILNTHVQLFMPSVMNAVMTCIKVTRCLEMTPTAGRPGLSTTTQTKPMIIIIISDNNNKYIQKYNKLFLITKIKKT